MYLSCTATGKEDVAAESKAEAKGAEKIVTNAAKKAALQRKKSAAKHAKKLVMVAKAQTLVPQPYFRGEAAPLNVGHPTPFGGESVYAAYASTLWQGCATYWN
jgi:hypothetical protein